MSRTSIWAPSWPWVVGFGVLIYGLFFAAASSGLNPFRSVAAVLWGGIGGALGALVQELLKNTRWRDSWIRPVLPIVGMMAGTSTSKGASVLLANTVGQETATFAVLGLAAGAVCGLLPKSLIPQPGEHFRNGCFWVSAASGMFGGLLLALPLSVVLTVFGRHRFNTRQENLEEVQEDGRAKPAQLGATPPSSSQDGIGSGLNPPKWRKSLLLPAMVVWAVAWVLPGYGSSESFIYGWQCFRYTSLNLLEISRGLYESGTDVGIFDFIQALSPWTNFLLPISILFLHSWRPSWLRKKIASLFYVAWIINLVWIGDGELREGLMVGYYLWQLSFLVIGFALSAIVQEENAEKFMLFERMVLADRAANRAFSNLLAILLLVMFILSSPFGPKEPDDSEDETPGVTTAPSAD